MSTNKHIYHRSRLAAPSCEEQEPKSQVAAQRRDLDRARWWDPRRPAGAILAAAAGSGLLSLLAWLGHLMMHL